MPPIEIRKSTFKINKQTALSFTLGVILIAQEVLMDTIYQVIAENVKRGVHQWVKGALTTFWHSLNFFFYTQVLYPNFLRSKVNIFGRENANINR